MGAYINPKVGEKEDFLREKGKRISAAQFGEFIYEDTTLLPVCLVDNGFFTAAAIAYDERKRDVFLRPDPRPKRYYLCTIEDLKLNSNLEDYLRK